MPEGPADALQQ